MSGIKKNVWRKAPENYRGIQDDLNGDRARRGAKGFRRKKTDDDIIGEQLDQDDLVEDDGIEDPTAKK